jgi:GT2 family glycosyltransferase
MICCRNFVTHLLTVRKELVDAFNNEPGSEFDGAQDYHMTMAIAEQARNIYHARRVLYHWRIHKNSTAANSAAKPYTVEAGRRAIQAHLDRCHIPATAVCDEEKDNFYHVDYEIPAGSKVSIVIPNKDAKDVLKRCVDSIFEKTTYPHFELVIVENNSTTQEIFDYYQELTAAHTNVRVVTYEGSFNYSAINNLGVAATTGTHLLFLNNDTQVIEPNWLQLLMGPLVRPGVGAVGAKLLYPNGLIQHVGVILSGDGFGHVSRLYPGDELGYGEYPSLMAREMLAVTGACLMTTRAYFDAVGGFDEGLPVAYNDVDLCLRLREAGLVSVVNPRALLYHYESVSRGYDEDSPQKRARLEREKGLMMRRWAHWYVQGDPYYNANCAPGSDLYQLDMRPIY